MFLCFNFILHLAILTFLVRPEVEGQSVTSYPVSNDVHLSQLNVENINSGFDESESDFEESEEEIGDRRRSISVAAINAQKIRNKNRNSGNRDSVIKPPNWNWNPSETGQSFCFVPVLKVGRNQVLN